MDTRHILLNLVAENARNIHDREANVIVVEVKDQPGSKSKKSDKKTISNFFKALGLETVVVMERPSLIGRPRQMWSKANYEGISQFIQSHDWKNLISKIIVNFNDVLRRILMLFFKIII